MGAHNTVIAMQCLAALVMGFGSDVAAIGKFADAAINVYFKAGITNADPQGGGDVLAAVGSFVSQASQAIGIVGILHAGLGLHGIYRQGKLNLGLCKTGHSPPHTTPWWSSPPAPARVDCARNSKNGACGALPGFVCCRECPPSTDRALPRVAPL